jgi:hypothetical protein
MARRRNPSTTPTRFLSSAELRAAAKAALALAKKSGARAAICGGYALQLFGSDRLTHDLDLMSDGALLARPTGTLTFGGYKYRVKGVPVDVIIREDNQASLYSAALADCMRTKSGLDVIRPEWMTVIKLLARRSKDHFDLMFLLRKPGLVNRKSLKRLLEGVYGDHAFLVLDELENIFLEADMGAARDSRHNA